MSTVFPMYLTWNTEKPCAVDVSEIYEYEYEYEYERYYPPVESLEIGQLQFTLSFLCFLYGKVNFMDADIQVAVMSLSPNHFILK